MFTLGWGHRTEFKERGGGHRTNQSRLLAGWLAGWVAGWLDGKLRLYSLAQPSFAGAFAELGNILNKLNPKQTLAYGLHPSVFNTKSTFRKTNGQQGITEESPPIAKHGLP